MQRRPNRPHPDGARRLLHGCILPVSSCARRGRLLERFV